MNKKEKRIRELVGQLLDWWDQLPNDVKTDPDLEKIAKIIDEINEAIES
jgi:uncharacterized protein HemY